MTTAQKQRRRLVANCSRKFRHDTFMSAQAEARRLTIKSKELTQAFHCDNCNGYHTGRPRIARANFEPIKISTPGSVLRAGAL